jgi:hypothetical protein
MAKERQNNSEIILGKLRPLVTVTMLTASVRMRSELGVLHGLGRQLIADNQKLK